MRYSGGLLGGSWLTALTGDIGGGGFDGAWLVKFREHEPFEHALEQAIQSVFEGRHRGRALPRLREMLGRPCLAQRCGDAVHRRQPFRRQQARHGGAGHRGREADRPARDPLADRLLLLQGRRHHAAAAGAGLDHRPLRQRRRHPRPRPDHRLLRPRERRPPRHLRLRRRGEEGARGVRVQHRLHRHPAARPLRGRDHAARGRRRRRRPDLGRLPDPLRRPRHRRRAGDRRHRPRGRAPLRGRRPDLGDQPRPLPQLRAALRARHGRRAAGRVAAPDAPAAAPVRAALRQEPADAARRRPRRANPRGARAGGGRQRARQARGRGLAPDRGRARRLPRPARPLARAGLPRRLRLVAAAGAGRPAAPATSRPAPARARIRTTATSSSGGRPSCWSGSARAACGRPRCARCSTC